VKKVKVFKRIYYWIDERVEMHDYIKKDILDKPIPKGLNLSFCFGGITFFLFLMLAVTGYFMTIYYVPSPDHAYDAVDYMTYEVAMGQIIRGVHFWAANLTLTLAFGFTGYLLPWDQKAYWATKVGTSIMGTVPFLGEFALKITRGGEQLSALTLARFYSLHVIFLPIATAVLLMGHFFMIRKQGISTPL
jgi:quinol-cytochrome oxidoreductase complex cytochrome b subunit